VRPSVRSRPGVIALGLLVVHCGGSGPDSPTAPSPAPSSAPSRFTYNGVTHVSWWHDQYQYGEADVARQELAGTGANWAGVLVTWYMARTDSTEIAADLLRTPTDEAVRQAVRDLRGRRLKVMLKPHVDVQDGTWRGTIAPRSAADWFASYRGFLAHYAALAQEEGVELLCVGTELATMTRAAHAAEWEAMIAETRARFRGLLTYAANANVPGDEYTSVPFWGRLDLLGLDVYTPLTGKTNPTRAELEQGWTRNRDGNNMVAAYRNWQGAWGKPVLFTEIGYRSGDGANRAPWDFGVALPPDPGEQADCYAAAFAVWTREGAWMQGAFWWSWSVPPPAPGDTGFDPRRKPAEEVLRQQQQGSS
jgi:hypothetical protein